MLRRLLPLAFLLPLVFAGCDTADTNGGDTFPLPSAHDASFVFDAGPLEAGESYTSDPVTQLSQSVINDDRYEPSDVASARIREGTIELQLDFPGGDDQAITIDAARLTLSAENVGDQVVARGSDITLAILTTSEGPARRTTLDVVAPNITEFLQQESFTGVLMLDVAGAGTGSYQFTVAFDADIEVTVDAAVRAGAATR